MAYDRVLYLLDFQELEAPGVAEHEPGSCGPATHVDV
jgi:hypothetical protein